MKHTNSISFVPFVTVAWFATSWFILEMISSAMASSPNTLTISINWDAALLATLSYGFLYIGLLIENLIFTIKQTKNEASKH